MTNGSRFLGKVDGRSAIGRRMRDLRDELLAGVLARYNRASPHGEPPLSPDPLGFGDLSIEAAMLVKSICTSIIAAEVMESSVANGEAVDTNDLVRVLNLAQRSSEKLVRLSAVLRPEVADRMREAQNARDDRARKLAAALAEKDREKRAKAMGELGASLPDPSLIDVPLPTEAERTVSLLRRCGFNAQAIEDYLRQHPELASDDQGSQDTPTHVPDVERVVVGTNERGDTIKRTYYQKKGK